MNRSRPAVRQAIKFIQDGGIGKVYMARGLCFKPRPPIGKYPDGPMAAGEQYKLNVEATTSEPAYDAAYLSKVDYDLWLGPGAEAPFNRNRFHYNWHWHWDYGNGDTGNQGPHQFDIARWGLGKKEHPVQGELDRRLLRRRESSQETPDIHTSLVRVRRRHRPRVRHARCAHQRRRHASRSATCSTAPKAGCGSTATAASGSRTRGAKDEKGPGSDAPPDQRRQRSARAHEHRVAALPELRRCAPRRRPQAADVRHPRRPPARRRCRTWRTSPTAPGVAQFDGKTETFVNDKEADRLPHARVPQGLRGQRDDVGRTTRRWAVAPAPTAHRHSFNAPSIGNVSPLHARRAVHATPGPIQNGSSAGRPSGRNAVVAR